MAQTISWNPESYAKNARFVADLGEPLLQLLDPKPLEIILDLGCGDGALTEKIVAAGCIVYGCDSSLAQIQAARRRGINTFVTDGQQLALRPRFDAVFTNAALHWMKHAEKVIEGVATALKSQGRFVGEFGGRGNVETIRQALHASLRKRGIDPWSVDPWYYAAPAEYTEILKRHGFTVDTIELIPRPTKLPGDIRGWLDVFAQPFIKAVTEVSREIFLAEIRNELESVLRQPDGTWIADYVRLRFKAIKNEPGLRS
ncbi:MAG: Class SAM-dependent methyltransferase [Deltaproteobacteria bacterium]|nr:Class SAM-dependent methyltransferase [Deltaproteobacteria bacterium]